MDINVNPKHRFSEPVVRLLADATKGISDSEQWYHIMGLVAKSEHDGGPASWDASDKKGVSVFNYAEALKYDIKKRGVTLGLVGFTTHHQGKPNGDAQPLFEAFDKMGGKPSGLGEMTEGLNSSKKKAKQFCEIIEAIDDPKWIECQWLELLKAPFGYLYYTMKVLGDRGLPSPKALTIAMVFDHSLNCGCEGDHCAQKIFDQIPKDIKGPAKEMELVKQFTLIRRGIIGNPKFDYNSPKSNGEHRADMFADLVNFPDLKGPGAAKAVEKAVSWEMQ